MASVRGLNPLFSSICYAHTQVIGTEVDVFFTATVNSIKSSEKAFKLFGKAHKVHLHAPWLCKDNIFVWKEMAIFCRHLSSVLLLRCHVLMILFQSNISHSESFWWEEFLEGFRKVKSARHGFHLECISYKDLLARVPLHNVPWKAKPCI